MFYIERKVVRDHSWQTRKLKNIPCLESEPRWELSTFIYLIKISLETIDR
jgi:hypothetical protein